MIPADEEKMLITTQRWANMMCDKLNPYIPGPFCRQLHEVGQEFVMNLNNVRTIVRESMGESALEDLSFEQADHIITSTLPYILAAGKEAQQLDTVYCDVNKGAKPPFSGMLDYAVTDMMQPIHVIASKKAKHMPQ